MSESIVEARPGLADIRPHAIGRALAHVEGTRDLSGDHLAAREGWADHWATYCVSGDDRPFTEQAEEAGAAVKMATSAHKACPTDHTAAALRAAGSRHLAVLRRSLQRR